MIVHGWSRRELNESEPICSSRFLSLEINAQNFPSRREEIPHVRRLNFVPQIPDGENTAFPWKLVLPLSRLLLL